MPTCILPQWHIDVPGSRWFRADLHVHTLDDHPCSEFKWPISLCGEPHDKEVQKLYAKKFLKNAIEKQIEVIGLTPHAIRSSQTADSSATWAIVDEWLTGIDDDGIAFKNKIYAIFPGFEPSLCDGSAGLHLLFLFDSSIGKQAYFDAYSEVMGAVPTWRGNSLNLSNKSAKDAFKSLHLLQLRLKPSWNYICLAAHAFGEKGLFKLQSQVLETFPHQYISGLQLGNSMVPENVYMNKPWLKDSMKEYHQGFFHSSDSYSFDDIGSYFSMFKLASPTIESLRQAFLANDSRIRMCYTKQAENLVLDSNLPQPNPWDRQWLKSVKIVGGCSFFNSETNQQKPAYEEFDFSPDLTCIIGGRMSGKSTLLDGIRYVFEHELPKNKQLQKDVVDRARTKFLSGSPSIKTEIKGPENETLPLKDRWSARFYTQREIQQIANDQSALKSIIYGFSKNGQCALFDAENELASLNSDIESLENSLLTARENLLQTESIFLTAKKSKEALSKFQDAGISDLENLQKDASKIKQNSSKTVEAIDAICSLPQDIEYVDPEDMLHTLSRDLLDDKKMGDNLKYKTKKYKIARRYMLCIVNSLLKDLNSLSAGFDVLLLKTKKNIVKKLVELGEAPEIINQFEKLTKDSKDYEIAAENLLDGNIKYLHMLRNFVKKIKLRQKLLETKRELLCTNIASVSEIFDKLIKVSIIENGSSAKLNNWVQNLKDQGITRWWNNCREKGHYLSSQEIYYNYKHNSLSLCEMSNIVSGNFISKMNFENKIKLLSICSDDTFVVELLVDSENNDYKPLQELSGGAQISVLLSLILESGDSTPLVIDQPEDEIDKAYLFDALIPSLRRLKGKRQIIFSTHDPNIVVNADADLVVYLEANSKRSCVKSRGAIEEDDIKKAIIKILDGGEEAFKLRKQKYGF